MRRFTAFLLALALLFCVAVFSSADSGSELRLVFTPEGRMVKDLGGNKINGAVSDDVFNKIYTLAQNGKIDTADVASSEFEVFLAEDGSVSFGKQTLTAKDGTVYVSSNAEAVIFEHPNRFYGCGSGESVLSVTDAAGNELSSSTAKVTAMTSGKNLVINSCPNCGDNQTDRLHAMSCGHFSCEEGTVDHGSAACGCAGHYKCDGADHGLCSNCLEPLCQGEHGEGVCKHTHTVDRSDLLYSRSRHGMFQIVYCPVCGVYYIDQLW